MRFSPKFVDRILWNIFISWLSIYKTIVRNFREFYRRNMDKFDFFPFYSTHNRGRLCCHGNWLLSKFIGNKIFARTQCHRQTLLIKQIPTVGAFMVYKLLKTISSHLNLHSPFKHIFKNAWKWTIFSTNIVLLECTRRELSFEWSHIWVLSDRSGFASFLVVAKLIFSGERINPLATIKYVIRLLDLRPLYIFTILFHLWIQKISKIQT